MTDPKTLNIHAALVNRMGDAVGVDFSQAKARGDISDQDWSETVLRCTRCSQVGACQKLLVEAGPLGKAPEYCNNRGLMDRLQAGLEDKFAAE